MVGLDQLLQVALRNVPLFRCPGGSVVATVAQVTGVPIMLLERAERLITITASLAPLQALLSDPAVPKVEQVRCDCQVQYARAERGAARQEVAQCLTLVLCSAKGQVALTLAITLGRSAASRAMDRQTARVMVKWLLDTPTLHQVCKHELTLAGELPRRLPWAAAA